jgi:hypothetical protein
VVSNAPQDRPAEVSSPTLITNRHHQGVADGPNPRT